MIVVFIVGCSAKGSWLLEVISSEDCFVICISHCHRCGFIVLRLLFSLSDANGNVVKRKEVDGDGDAEGEEGDKEGESAFEPGADHFPATQIPL